MNVATKATKEQGIKDGYLQNKTVILKPVIRTYPLINDRKDHVLYFMQDGASKFFVLPKNNYNEFVNIFKNENEKEFFEEILGLDLNFNKKTDNFWEKFTVKITKNVNLMEGRIKFDLSDPMDNIRVRIIRLYPDVTEGWENRYDKPKSKFCLVDSDFQEVNSNKEMDILETIWTFRGEIKNSPKKLRDFLTVYYLTKKSTKTVPDDFTVEQLNGEIRRIIEDDKDVVYKIITDPDKDIKLFISRAVRCGAIERKGVTGYAIPGDPNQYDFRDMVEHIKALKEATDVTYMKIDTQIKQAKLA